MADITAVFISPRHLRLEPTPAPLAQAGSQPSPWAAWETTLSTLGNPSRSSLQSC